ncbi:MAG: hypothetical protein AAF587_21015 [Bacteroidota bacterium]
MKVDELKLGVLDTLAQVIVFERNGTMVDSCHGLADISALIGQSAFDIFPLVGSIKEVLAGLTTEAPPIKLPAVEFLLIDKKGYFDIQFFAHPANPDLLVWVLVDNTSLYEYFGKIQKERNLLRMEKEQAKR